MGENHFAPVPTAPFIREMPFTAERNRIRGEETFAAGDFTISVVLTK